MLKKLLMLFLAFSLSMGAAFAATDVNTADQASLELAGQPKAFIAGEIKMARDNKDNVAIAPWVVWLFRTHPATIERIHTAEQWQR